MKKLACLIAIIILLPIAIAGKSYDLEDFSKEPNQAVWLSPGDEARFEMLGGVHSLFVESIDKNNNSADIKVFPFRTTANYVTLTKGKNNLRADFDKDGNPDLKISLYELKNGRAMVLFEKIENSDKTQDVGYTPPPEGQGVIKEKKSYAVYYLIAAIAILVIISIFLRQNPKSNAKKKRKPS